MTMRTQVIQATDTAMRAHINLVMHAALHAYEPDESRVTQERCFAIIDLAAALVGLNIRLGALLGTLSDAQFEAGPNDAAGIPGEATDLVKRITAGNKELVAIVTLTPGLGSAATAYLY